MYYLAFSVVPFVQCRWFSGEDVAFGWPSHRFDSGRHPPELGTPIRFGIQLSSVRSSLRSSPLFVNSLADSCCRSCVCLPPSSPQTGLPKIALFPDMHSRLFGYIHILDSPCSRRHGREPILACRLSLVASLLAPRSCARLACSLASHSGCAYTMLAFALFSGHSFVAPRFTTPEHCNGPTERWYSINRCYHAQSLESLELGYHGRILRLRITNTMYSSFFVSATPWYRSLSRVYYPR